MKNKGKSLLNSKRFELGNEMNNVTGGLSPAAVAARYYEMTKSYSLVTDAGSHLDADQSGGTFSID
jgi:hypothetical protein